MSVITYAPRSFGLVMTYNRLLSHRLVNSCCWSSLYLSDVRRLSSTSEMSQRLKEKNSSSKQIVESREKPFAEMTVGEKVQQAGKDATYTGIIVAGVVVTGLMFFAIGRELFSGQSPSGVYSRAVKLCENSDKVRDAIGEPMKAYGEMNRRGRRRFVKHALYEKDGIKRMRVLFYLEGPHNNGTVHVDMKQDDRGKYQFDYVSVELEQYPGGVIVVEDNRHRAVTFSSTAT